MLIANQLTKKYGSFTALQNLDVHIKEGEIYCLLGANGAGKSTTINLFLGFISPTSGNVSINGTDVNKEPIKTKKYLAYIPENLMLYPMLTGLENLTYFSSLAGMDYPKHQLYAFLEHAGLQKEAANKRVETYSKGMRQKVGIAIALAKDAKVLLLDEPTSGLDPQASNEFSNLLLSLQSEGIATLMATHDIFRAKQIATHIGIMKQGQLVKQFSNQDLTLSELEKTYLDIIQLTQ